MWRTLTLGLLLVASPATVLAQTRKAPDFVLKDLSGRNVTLSSYKGKIVLLNFWATWCPPCRAEMPELVTWQRQYRARGLQVIGVTYPPTNRNEVRRFVRGIKTNYPIVLGRKETKALFYDGETLPISVVIYREGNVRETIEGILLPEEFKEKIRPLLQQSNGDRTHHSTFKNGFASNVRGPVRFGLAAGCAAAAVPRRKVRELIGGCAPVFGLILRLSDQRAPRA